MIPERNIYHSTSCAVCLENYNKSEINQCSLLKCGHIFHEICALPWIEQQNSCPLCRDRTFTLISLKEYVQQTISIGAEFGKNTILRTVNLVAIGAIGLGLAKAHRYGLSLMFPLTPAPVDHYPLPDFTYQNGLKLGLFIAGGLVIEQSILTAIAATERRMQTDESAETINYIPPQNI